MNLIKQNSYYFVVAVVLMTSLIIASCGGNNGTGEIAPERPSGTIEGTAFDGLIINGDVTIYAFGGGEKGEELSVGTTNNLGRYSLSLQAADQPILICVTGGRYIEEASGRNVPILPGQTICAAKNYISGEPISTSLTYYTYLAVGLTQYLVSTGKPITEAIEEANNRISQLINIDIAAIAPLDMTDSINATTVASEGHLYGIATAAISSLTQFISNQNESNVHSVYNSMLFIQQAYEDIKADGILNGQGQEGILSLGIVPITTETYRHKLAENMFVMVSSARNATGLTSSDIMNDVISLNDSDDAIFNEQVPVNFNLSKPVITNISISKNDVLSKITVISAAVSDITGVSGAEIMVDDQVVATFDGNEEVTIELDTTIFADGNHSIVFKARNAFDGIRVETIDVFFGNEQTAISNILPLQDSFVRGNVQISAAITDSIGVVSVELLINGQAHSLAVDTEKPVFSVDSTILNDGINNFTIRATNTVGFEKEVVVNYSVDNSPPNAEFTQHAEGFLLQGLEAFEIAVNDNLGLDTAEVFLDGELIARFTDLNNTLLTFDLDTTTRTNRASTLVVIVVDKAGNTKIVELSGFLDNSDPDITITSPIQNEGIEGGFNIIANVSDDVGVSSVEFLIDDVHFAFPANINLPNQLVNSQSFSDGPHKVTVIAIAKSGRVATQSVNIIIDNSAPTLAWVINSCKNIEAPQTQCGTAYDCLVDISLGAIASEPDSPVTVTGTWTDKICNYPECGTTFENGILNGVAITGHFSLTVTATNQAGLSVSETKVVAVTGFDQCFFPS